MLSEGGKCQCEVVNNKLRVTPFAWARGEDRIKVTLRRGNKSSSGYIGIIIEPDVPPPPPPSHPLLVRDPFPPDARAWTKLIEKEALGCTATNKPDKRCTLGPGPVYSVGSVDHAVPSLIHTVNLSDSKKVSDLAHIPFCVDQKNTNARQYLLRYTFYATEYHGVEGKLITLEGGLGYAGNGPNGGGTYNEHLLRQYPEQHAKSSDGWACFTMHPAPNDTTNALSGYAAYQNMISKFGENFGDKSTPYPKGRWNVVDVVMQGPPSAFLKVYLNGKLRGTKTGIGQVAYDGRLKDCNILFLMIRLMFGGSFEDLVVLRKVIEYFGPCAIYRGDAA